MVKNFDKSVHICHSYDETSSVLLFDSQCTMLEVSGDKRIRR